MPAIQEVSIRLGAKRQDVQGMPPAVGLMAASGWAVPRLMIINCARQARQPHQCRLLQCCWHDLGQHAQSSTDIPEARAQPLQAPESLRQSHDCSHAEWAARRGVVRLNLLHSIALSPCCSAGVGHGTRGAESMHDDMIDIAMSCSP